jgi:hypothetical protein
VLSSKLTFFINFLTLAVFGAIIYFQVTEAQYFEVQIQDLMGK